MKKKQYKKQNVGSLLNREIVNSEIVATSEVFGGYMSCIFRNYGDESSTPLKEYLGLKAEMDNGDKIELLKSVKRASKKSVQKDLDKISQMIAEKYEGKQFEVNILSDIDAILMGWGW